MSVSAEAKRFLLSIAHESQARPCYRLSEVAGYEPLVAKLLGAGLISRTRMGRYPAIEITDAGLAVHA